jgi:hypothetical protein
MFSPTVLEKYEAAILIRKTAKESLLFPEKRSEATYDVLF